MFLDSLLQYKTSSCHASIQDAIEPVYTGENTSENAEDFFSTFCGNTTAHNMKKLG